MGAKSTKIEGTYLPETPMLRRVSAHPMELHSPITVRTDFGESQLCDPLDPRSPNGCRTPLSILHTRPVQLQQQEVIQQQTPSESLENPLSILRKRFLKGFTYNLNDPRSPNMLLNRTPLVFDDVLDKTLNLDDTFADLFVESRAPSELVAEDEEMFVDADANVTEILSDTSTNQINSNNSVKESSFTCEQEEETIPSSPKLAQTPVGQLQQQHDPRSPTIGVDRTPIIFNDDDEDNEDAMLESILATLSLNLSNSSSVSSFNTELISTKECISRLNLDITSDIKPANKHIDRVRQNGRRPRMPQKSSHKRRQKIYEDRENSISPALNTPKKRTIDNSNSYDSVNKRTPLSCVKNRSHLRSRSVESSGKSVKTRLPLTSFDDSLNPVQSTKVTNMRIMQKLEDSLEL